MEAATAKNETETEREPEPEPEPEPEREPEPEPEPGQKPDTTGQPAGSLSQRDIERALANLEKEASRHANRVSEIMGADANDLVVCELCEPHIPGFRFPMLVGDEQRGRVLQALGMVEEVPMNDDPEALACDVCAGHGETLTGSRVPTTRTKPCPKCSAKGWTTEQERKTWESTQAAVQAAAAIPVYSPPAYSASSSVPATDMLGRPVGSEFYGRDPAYMSEAERLRDPWAPRT